MSFSRLYLNFWRQLYPLSQPSSSSSSNHSTRPSQWRRRKEGRWKLSQLIGFIYQRYHFGRTFGLILAIFLAVFSAVLSAFISAFISAIFLAVFSALFLARFSRSFRPFSREFKPYLIGQPSLSIITRFGQFLPFPSHFVPINLSRQLWRRFSCAIETYS